MQKTEVSEQIPTPSPLYINILEKYNIYKLNGKKSKNPFDTFIGTQLECSPLKAKEKQSHN